MSPPEVDAPQQQDQLIFGNPAHLPLILRPGEPLLFKTFGPQAESAVFPIEYLDRGSAAVTEHEAGTIERILTNTILHHHRQTVDLFAHVGGTGLNENGPIGM